MLATLYNFRHPDAFWSNTGWHHITYISYSTFPISHMNYSIFHYAIYHNLFIFHYTTYQMTYIPLHQYTTWATVHQIPYTRVKKL